MFLYSKCYVPLLCFCLLFFTSAQAMDLLSLASFTLRQTIALAAGAALGGTAGAVREGSDVLASAEDALTVGATVGFFANVLACIVAPTAVAAVPTIATVIATVTLGAITTYYCRNPHR